MSTTFRRTIKAAPKAVYEMLTREHLLPEWFCDTASTNARADGYYFAGWNTGDSVSGSFVQVEPEKSLVLQIRHRDEPSYGRVEITLEAQGERTHVTVNHADAGPEWHKQWTDGLENLQAVMEVGHDLRIVRRPMLGIMPMELDAETAAKLGVPVSKGIKLNGTVPNMGAEKAGLKADDVIVELDGKAITDYQSLPLAIRGHHAGDSVPVVIYRGAHKHTLELTFSQRQMPEIPASPESYAARLEKSYAELQSEVEGLFVDVSDGEGGRRPAAKEWSAREVVAHLIVSQRWILEAIGARIAGRAAGDLAPNTMQLVEALASMYSRNAAILAELKRVRAETVALVRLIPEEIAANRANMGYIALNSGWVTDHDREHFGQIKRTLETVRAAALAG
ncbi:MAG: SRPBCC domain-containing protein [Chloroflexi bacterium]|nr:SRPBCC domain-containing protein [Chloroflexota bacterium]